MVRKSSIYILFILLFVLIPGQLFSLGLGEIEVNSALNQPLDAQINLIAARDDEFEEMRVELAPANVFDRVGVPRPYFLTQLKFQPVKVPGGGTAIRVTSKDPVREPFLTFLVEVTWPKGRLLREYTVLLDPPEFAQQQAPQIATPVTTPVEQVPVEETIVDTQPVVSNQPEVIATEDVETIREQLDQELGLDQQEVVDVVEETIQPEVVNEIPVADVIEDAEIIEEVEPTVEELEEAVTETIVETQAAPQATYDNLESDVIIPEDIPGAEEVITSDTVETLDAEVISESEVYTQAVSGEVVVGAGDTLSKIAKSANQGRASSLNQMMLAIQQANPNAFINDNINLLKRGAVLRIPSEGEVSSLSSSEARNVIAQQNALWKEYRSKTGQIPAVNVDAPSLVTEESTDVAEAAEQALKEATKQTEAQQELNILASENANKSSNTQVAGGEEIKRLQKEINLAKELAASRGKEAEDLKERVGALESMLEKKEKILTIQNQQLKDLQSQLSSDKDKAAEIEKTKNEKAALEAQLKAEQEAQKAAELAKVKAEEEAKKAADLAAAAKLEAEAKAKEEADKAAEMAAAAKAEAEAKAKELAAKVETPLSKPRLEPLPDWDSLPEIEPVPEQVAEATPEETPVEKPAEVKPEVKPVEKPKTIVEKPAETDVGMMGKVLGFLDEYKSKLQVGSGILAVLLGGLWFWRRKQVKTVELSGLGDMPMEAMEDGAAFDDILDETIVTSDTGPDAQITNDDMSAMDDFEDMGDASAAPASEADGIEAEDVLDEADVYISYGLHQQAQDLLTDAIAKEPGRNDYKVKLAEVYYSQKDQAGFEQYAEKIKSEVGEGSEDWQNIIAMGKELAPSSAMFAGAAAGAAAIASSVMDKPEAADIDIGLDAGLESESFADASLEDTIIENEPAENASAQDINIDDFEDDPIASKIMQANETSDILNFDVDDISDDILEEEGGDLDSVATGLHETATMGDLTEEIEEIGMHTTMNDLKPLDIDEDVLGTEETKEIDLGIETPSHDPEATVAFTSTPEGDPEATAAFSATGLNESLDATEQFDASSMDTEFLDPAEQTIAQTHTDLEELGPPSLIEEVGTKLDLAKAFVDMGDSDAAKETLIEVISEGDESQIKAAKDLMDKLGG